MPDSRLAVAGGEPLAPRGRIMTSKWPQVLPEDVDRVMQQLRSALLTEMFDRELVQNFEAEMAALCQRRYALTTSSGTSALHCALAGLGVQPGDEVIVPALTFIACAAAVVHHQAVPVFADVDPFTYNITAASVARAVSDRTKAIMVVHLHGLPADMDAIQQVADKHGIPILEDFAQAMGAIYRGRPAGSFGAVSAASLVAGKNLPAAGEGGILVTDDREVRNRAASLKCFGEAVEADGSRRLIHETMGWNYRMNMLSLAFASQQLFRLEHYTRERQASARKLDEVLRLIPGFSPPLVPENTTHAYHMYRFRFDPAAAGLAITLDQAREGLKKVFWEEGLPLVEFQNMPLPGHALFQGKVGYGRGCPWSCPHARKIEYRLEDYPGALDAIRSSLIVGVPAKAVLCNPEVVDYYSRCFLKLHSNFRSFERFAAELPAAPPWAEAPRLF